MAASCQDVLHHFAMHVGQTIVTSLEAVGEAGVIEAQQVHRGGVEVVNVDGVFRDVVAEVIGLTVDVAAFDARSGERPQRP